MKLLQVIFAILIGISVQAQPKPEDILKEINIFRKSQGLSQAKLTPRHCQAAQLQADWISTTDIYNHVQTRPENGKPLLKNPWDRGNFIGVTVVAENLFQVPKSATPKYVVDGWINSPGHKLNMMYGVPPEIECQFGIAVAPMKSNNNYVIIVLVIGDNVNHETGEIRR